MPAAQPMAEIGIRRQPKDAGRRRMARTACTKRTLPGATECPARVAMTRERRGRARVLESSSHETSVCVDRNYGSRPSERGRSRSGRKDGSAVHRRSVDVPAESGRAISPRRWIGSPRPHRSGREARPKPPRGRRARVRAPAFRAAPRPARPRAAPRVAGVGRRVVGPGLASVGAAHDLAGASLLHAAGRADAQPRFRRGRLLVVLSRARDHAEADRETEQRPPCVRGHRGPPSRERTPAPREGGCNRCTTRARCGGARDRTRAGLAARFRAAIAIVAVRCRGAIPGPGTRAV